MLLELLLELLLIPSPLVGSYVYKFCSPTRASFLTGRLPGHGIQLNNLGMTSAVGCNLNLTMIPAHLKAAGYRSAQVGKWCVPVLVLVLVLVLIARAAGADADTGAGAACACC